MPGAPGLREDRLHRRARGVDEGLELLAVGVQVGDRPRRHARLGGGARHRRRDLLHQPVVERLGDQVLGPEAQVGAGIGRRDDLALLGPRQLGDGAHGGDFHRVGHRGGAAVERTAEDVGKTQDVVDLVRVVGAAGGEDGVRAHRQRFFGRDLGRRVGEREDDGLARHRRHHRRLEHAAGRQAQEDVRPGQHLGQRALVGGLREGRLVLVHQLGAAGVDDTGQVGGPDVFPPHAELDQQPQAGQRRGAGARGHELDLADRLADDRQRVEQRRADDDGGAVLVVVEDGDLHALAQAALDVEAVGRLDVLEVDAAEGGFQRGDHVDQLVEVALVDLEVEDVDAGELLEQHRLAFHHRLGRQRADVAQAQHRGAVGDHRHQVAARRVAEGIGGVGDDLLARRCDAGRIGQRQVVLVDHLLGRLHRDLAGDRKLVVLERGLLQLGGLLYVGGAGVGLFFAGRHGAVSWRLRLRHPWSGREL